MVSERRIHSVGCGQQRRWSGLAALPPKDFPFSRALLQVHQGVTTNLLTHILDSCVSIFTIHYPLPWSSTILRVVQEKQLRLDDDKVTPGWRRDQLGLKWNWYLNRCYDHRLMREALYGTPEGIEAVLGSSPNLCLTLSPRSTIHSTIYSTMTMHSTIHQMSIRMIWKKDMKQR